MPELLLVIFSKGRNALKYRLSWRRKIHILVVYTYITWQRRMLSIIQDLIRY